jgi:MFS family permease
MMRTVTVARLRGGADRRGGAPSRRCLFGLVAYGLVAVLAGANLPTPLYPYYQRVNHLSTVALTGVFVAYVLAVSLALIGAGQLSDRHGRRAVLLPALVFAVIGMAAFAVADSVVALVIGRIASGLASGGFTAVGAAALADLEPSGDTRRAALVASAATVAGLALGPLISGLLVQYGPWPTRLVYLLELVALGPAFVGVLGLPRQGTGGGPRPRLRLPTVPRSTRPAFLRSTLAFSAGWVGTAMFFALGPTFAGEILRTSNSAAEAGVVGAVFVPSALAQLLSQRLARARATIVGLVLFLAGMSALPVALALHQPTVLLVAAAATGAGQGLTHRATQSLVTHAAPTAQRGQVVAAFYLAGYATVAVLLVALGRAIDATSSLIGLTGFVAVVAVMAALSLCLVWRAEVTQPASAPVRPEPISRR